MARLRSRSVSRIVALLLLAVGAPTLSCRGAESTAASDPPVKARLTLLDAQGRQATSFAAGERITLRLVVTNHGGEPRRLSCATARTVDARIYADDEELWHASRGKMFAQVITDLELPPGESRTLELVWHQVTNDDEPVGPGTYEVESWVPAMDGAVRAPRVTFSIR